LKRLKTICTGAFIRLFQETDEAPPPAAVSWRGSFIFPLTAGGAKSKGVAYSFIQAGLALLVGPRTLPTTRALQGMVEERAREQGRHGRERREPPVDCH
jgi:hypothetical protein